MHLPNLRHGSGISLSTTKYISVLVKELGGRMDLQSLSGKIVGANCLRESENEHCYLALEVSLDNTTPLFHGAETIWLRCERYIDTPAQPIDSVKLAPSRAYLVNEGDVFVGRQLVSPTHFGLHQLLCALPTVEGVGAHGVSNVDESLRYAAQLVRTLYSEQQQQQSTLSSLGKIIRLATDLFYILIGRRPSLIATPLPSLEEIEKKFYFNKEVFTSSDTPHLSTRPTDIPENTPPQYNGVAHVEPSSSRRPPQGCRMDADLSGNVVRTGTYPVAAGGYAIVWHGELRPNTAQKVIAIRQVAMKTIRMVNPEDNQQNPIHNRLRREIQKWINLKHANVIETLGYSIQPDEDSPAAFSVVTRWYSNGPVTSYLATHEDADRIRMCEDIAAGLVYLHSREQPVVHGDIKSSNVLVDDDGRCVLGDFGLIIVLNDVDPEFTSSTVLTIPRYLAPETLSEEPPSLESDMYSFASVCGEILQGVLPFGKYKAIGAIYGALIRGEPPFDLSKSINIPPKISSALQICWSTDPARRHNSSQFLAILQGEGHG